MEKKGRIFSGMRPTGRLHLGNYLGALDNWVKLQHDYECFFSVVDWHALTTAYKDTELLRENIREMTIDWLSAGLDPEGAVIFRQSDVKEHGELHLLLSMITPLSWLERCPTYKEQLKQLADREITTYGFLGYPVLMAADILVYKADTVPVGEDQLPHLELAREIVRRFNFLYEPVFPEPQSKLTQVPLLPGLDGRKMSKSYGNVLLLAEDPEVLKGKIRQMVTDPQRVRRHDPGDPEVCPVFAFHKVFSPQQLDFIDVECRRAGIGCVDCKKQLWTNLIEELGPIYERRQELEKDPGFVEDVLREGAVKARQVAEKTMAEVRKVMRL
jgi:tryptophanyl-tRNA synthetase